MIAELLRLIALFALAIVAGWTTIRSADGAAHRRGVMEMIGLSIATGLGLMGLAVMWLGMAGFSASSAVLLFAGLTICAAIFSIWKFVRGPSRTSPKLSPALGTRQRRWEMAGLIQLAVLAAFPTAMVALDVLQHPIHEWDAIAIWLLKAKIIFAAPLTPKPAYFHDVTLSYSHLDYPLLWPSMIAGVFAAIGGINDQLARCLDPALCFAMTATMYAASRQYLDRLPSAALTALAMNTPMFISLATADHADFPMMTFYLAAVYLTVRWLTDGRRGDLTLAILFNALLAQTKNEGMAVAAVNVLATGLALFIPARGSTGPRRVCRGIGWVVYAFGLALLLTPWMVWSMGLPRTDEAYSQRLTIGALWAGRHRVLPVLKLMFDNATDFGEWGFVWISTAAIALIGFKAFRRREVIAVWLMLLGHLLAYVAVYLVTPWDLELLFRYTLERLLAHTAPALFILLAMHWGEISSRTTSPLAD